MDSSPLVVLGGGAMLLVLLVRIVLTDRSWRSLIAGLEHQLTATRSELLACGEERSGLRKEVDTLRGEVRALRDRLHLKGLLDEGDP